MKLYKTNGIILKVKKFSEKDKLAWILTPFKGKITCLAKGAQQSKSKRGATIDIFNHNQFNFYAGKTFEYVTESRTIDDYKQIKTKYPYTIFYLAEILDKITLDEHEFEQIYKLVTNLMLLGKNHIEDFQKLVAAFEIKLLSLLGFEPNLFEYLDSGEKLTPKQDIYLSHITPGFLTSGEKDFKITPTLIKCQRFYLSNNYNSILNFKVDSEQNKFLQKINRIWLQNVLELKLKSLELINLDKN